MYKILIKTKSNKVYYSTYKVKEMDYESDRPREVEVDFITDSLDELAETYRELLNIYTADQLKPISELDVDILITIDDADDGE